MTALLLPGSRIVLEIDVALFLIVILTVGIVLTAMGIVLGMGMLRLGQRVSSLLLQRKIDLLIAENGVLREMTGLQRKLLTRQARTIGSARLARKLMQQSGM